PLTLQPGEARMIMLKELQHHHIPGTDGKPLPLSGLFGGMKLTEAPGGRHFLIDAVVYNPKTATCAACGYGCVYPRFLPRCGERLQSHSGGDWERSLSERAYVRWHDADGLGM